MHLYRTSDGIVVRDGGRTARVAGIGWSELLAAADPRALVLRHAGTWVVGPVPGTLLPPVTDQEVWAAGVTYRRSRDERMEESRQSGMADCYARVYAAPRPELFFKATGGRVVGAGGAIRVRGDSAWNVPEPELTLVVNAAGRIVGYTVGNDVSSRDIEGENPLYLPQAKIYEGSCAIGPCLWLTSDPIRPETAIDLEVVRDGAVAFAAQTELAQMKRSHEELVDYLFRELRFPNGCLLMTGTGIVPPPAFSLCGGDEVRIRIDPIGTLVNPVAAVSAPAA